MSGAMMISADDKKKMVDDTLHSQELIDNPWLLGSPTFGGNPVCCSAALADTKKAMNL